MDRSTEAYLPIKNYTNNSLSASHALVSICVGDPMSWKQYPKRNIFLIPYRSPQELVLSTRYALSLSNSYEYVTGAK